MSTIHPFVSVYLCCFPVTWQRLSADAADQCRWIIDPISSDTRRSMGYAMYSRRSQAKGQHPRQPKCSFARTWQVLRRADASSPRIAGTLHSRSHILKHKCSGHCGVLLLLLLSFLAAASQQCISSVLHATTCSLHLSFANAGGVAGCTTLSN